MWQPMLAFSQSFGQDYHLKHGQHRLLNETWASSQHGSLKAIRDLTQKLEAPKESVSLTGTKAPCVKHVLYFLHSDTLTSCGLADPGGTAPPWASPFLECAF